LAVQSVNRLSEVLIVVGAVGVKVQVLELTAIAAPAVRPVILTWRVWVSVQV
jgi:hypothetical protein